MRKICFTLIRDDTETLEKFKLIFEENKDLIRYLIVAEEEGKDGYAHFQGYAQFYRGHRLKSCKILFEDSRIHIEEQKGTNMEARNYCWKGSNEKGTMKPDPKAQWIDFGNFCQGQGTRSEMEEIKRNIDDGQSHYSIVQEQNKFNSYARYHSWFTRYKQMVDDRQYNRIRDPLKVSVIYGEPGTGKTTAILNGEGIENCYILRNPNGDNKNWNGYSDQSVLVIDDFYGWLPLNDMLNILDNKPYRCRKLGDYSWARWSKVYITSNVSMVEWYKSDNEKVIKILEALFSRIEKCSEVTMGNTGAIVVRGRFSKILKNDRHNRKNYFSLKMIESRPPPPEGVVVAGDPINFDCSEDDSNITLSTEEEYSSDFV